MQIASITFDGEKKKPANYIIPATFFTSLSPIKKQKTTVKVASVIIKKEVIKDPIKPVVSPKIAAPKPPVLQNLKRRNNSLSLKSIHQKKEQQKTLLNVNYDNHPKDSFTEKELQKTWMAKLDEESIFISALNKTHFNELKDLLYAKIKQLHEVRYPYNNFLY